jgi:hypothetical protein
LKAIREKTNNLKKLNHQNTADFSKDILKAKKAWREVF